MRAHLCGPERLGNLELVEHDDRFEISFDPCGSGGRGQRGDPVEGTPSRSDPPYGFGVTKEPHNWAGNEIGVCYYCAHCVFALELWPADRPGAERELAGSSALQSAQNAALEPWHAELGRPHLSDA